MVRLYNYYYNPINGTVGLVGSNLVQFVTSAKPPPNYFDQTAAAAAAFSANRSNVNLTLRVIIKPKMVNHSYI